MKTKKKHGLLRLSEKKRLSPLEQKALAQQYFERAEKLEEVSLGAAVIYYNKALKLNPRLVDAHLNLVGLYLRKPHQNGALSKALGHAWSAVRLDSKSALALYNLGGVYDQAGRISETITAFLEALSLEPKYADVLFDLAAVYVSDKQYAKAIAYWRAYLKLDPKSKWAAEARKYIKRYGPRSGLRPQK